MSWGEGSWHSSGTRDPSNQQPLLLQLLPRPPPALTRLNQPHQRRMEKVSKMAVRTPAKMKLKHQLQFQVVRSRERE
ncbi:MAG: hypothetical protein MJE68_07790 [Proteobacteria bacterium]|nr:hypothetical protein [Pseudomonadota bacterium]